MSNINQYFEKEECKGKATMNKAIQFNFTYHPNEGLSLGFDYIIKYDDYFYK